MVSELPEPVPDAGEVLIDVAAAGVNRADVLQRRGRYPPPPGAPSWPGLECAGVIAAVGLDVTGWNVGDRVAALLDGGGYAERAVAPAAQLLAVPDEVDLAAAAALPEAVCTAWSNLFMVARLRAGEFLLVHGGSGGVGTVATQLAAARGARVATTAGSPERVARCLELGAELGIDHTCQDFVAEVLDAAGGRGANVILDVVGAAYLDRNLKALAPDGRLVVIGLQQGRRAEVDLGLLLARRTSIHGTTLRYRPASQKAAIVSEVAAQAWPLLTDGLLRPVVHATLPLANAGEAHRLLESGEVFGKVVLTP